MPNIRKSPAERVFEKDQWKNFKLTDKICCFADLTKSCASQSSSIYKQDNEYVICYLAESEDFQKSVSAHED